MLEGGRIVNISSVLGRFGVPGYTAYCASKHGVIGLTRALALELAPRQITVNALCPGWVDTEMAEQGMRQGAAATGRTFEQFRERALGAVPIKRIIQPEEVAELVRFVSSPGAAAITGQTYNICGGQTLDLDIQRPTSWRMKQVLPPGLWRCLAPRSGAKPTLPAVKCARRLLTFSRRFEAKLHWWLPAERSQPRNYCVPRSPITPAINSSV